jgi:hypothetical protein
LQFIFKFSFNEGKYINSLSLQYNFSKFSFNNGKKVNLLQLQYKFFKFSFNRGNEDKLLFSQNNVSNSLNLDKSGNVSSHLPDILIQLVLSGKELI